MKILLVLSALQRGVTSVTGARCQGGGKMHQSHNFQGIGGNRDDFGDEADEISFSLKQMTISITRMLDIKFPFLAPRKRVKH